MTCPGATQFCPPIGKAENDLGHLSQPNRRANPALPVNTSEAYLPMNGRLDNQLPSRPIMSVCSI